MPRHTININDEDYYRLQEICRRNFRKQSMQVRKWMTEEERQLGINNKFTKESLTDDDLHNADHDGY